MKFTTLSIENFLTISTGTIRLDDQGLKLIQGLNHDDTSAISNGAGKSSVADALCWCLYGITARGVTGDDVVNLHAGKGTKVQVDIQDDSGVYRVARHRKHKKGKNTSTVLHLKDDGSIDELTKGTDKLTQEVIEKIVGASREVFKSAVYAGQEQMPDLPAMTDKSLKILIEEAAGVTLLEEAYTIAKDRARKSQDTVKTIDSELSGIDQKIDWLKTNIEDAEIAGKDWNVDLLKSIKDEVAKAKSKKKESSDLTDKIATLGEQKRKDGLANAKKKIAATNAEQTKYADLCSQATIANSEKSAAKDHIDDMEKEVARFTKELANVEHKVGCDCSECGREITEKEIEAAKLSVQNKLDAAKKNLKDANTALSDADKRAQKLTQERDDFKASMTDVTKESELVSKLTDDLAKIQSMRDKAEDLLIQSSEHAQAARDLKDKKNPHVGAIAKLTKQIDDLKDERAKKVADRKKIEAENAVAETAVKVFSPAGVRARVLDEVTPYLNQRTAHYLSTISDGNIDAIWTTLVKTAKGELREKFSIEVSNAKGSQSFGGLSGGEKRKVRISAALALQDLVATRASKPIDLFIGDEIDDALDSAGLERLTQILEEKARERGSVFVISHSDISDWISNIVLVEKSGGVTTLSEKQV